MNKSYKTKSSLSFVITSQKPHRIFSEGGFTLVEVLVSVTIILVFLPFAVSMLTNSRLLASYSKHKIQAAYVAQQLIETQRQNISAYFTPLPQSTTISGYVILDTKGIYNPTPTCSSSNIPCATASITVAPAVYTSTSGATQVPSTTIERFTVKITWNESYAQSVAKKQIFKFNIPMTETYVEDIANDSMLN